MPVIALTQEMGSLAKDVAQQLADELYISTETVKTHLRALFAKFGLDQTPDHNKRTRLAQCAMLSGVVTDHDL